MTETKRFNSIYDIAEAWLRRKANCKFIELKKIKDDFEIKEEEDGLFE